MTVAAFQKKVLAYAHLPTVFLSELSRVADGIPEEKRTDIVQTLDESAAREIEILAEGYQSISSAEKKVRKEAESADRATEMDKANSLLK